MLRNSLQRSIALRLVSALKEETNIDLTEIQKHIKDAKKMEASFDNFMDMISH
jgi:hypothetical protein